MRELFRLLSLLSVVMLSSTALAGVQLLTVVDEHGQPVSGATILLGYEPGNPFPDNVFITDANGSTGVPDTWKAALPITVQAPGFIANTIPVAQPGMRTLQISRQEPATEFEVKGSTNGYGRLITDGKVDFGLVIPAMRREQMLAFDVASIISPRSDKIEIVGNQIDIPSNIALPDQRETYIFPITFNKPDYRLYVRTPGQYRIGVTHGQFPLQRVVNDIRGGKSFLDVVNYFDFKEGGERILDVTGNVSGMDLTVNQIPFTGSFTVKAPAFAAKNAMLALSLIEQNGSFLPSDVKRFTPGQSINMKTNTSVGQPSLLAVMLDASSKALDPSQATQILRQFLAPLMVETLAPANVVIPMVDTPDFNKLSFAFTSAVNGAAPEFMPLIAKPAVNGQVISFEIPQLPNGVSAAAMYLSLSEIESIPNGSVSIERRTRLWEVISDAWLAQIELPKLTIQRKADRKYRWEVLFLGRPNNFIGESPVAPRVDLKSITHATRNSVDI
ncbi:MAG: hypothetical protein KF799_15445 [Bdellovibrionales bacterium]|nr:hypothetical protein [Bdellovibrionales bacterium]